MGRGLFPDLSSLPDGHADNIFPYVLQQYGGPGLTGLVVAGIFAAAFSTFDSIGSTLSALITRDVYGRLLVKDRDDNHYLSVGALAHSDNHLRVIYLCAGPASSGDDLYRIFQ